MGKNKLKRWAEMETFSNVFQPVIDFHSPDSELKGNWNATIFKNNNPVVLELGCGKGEYTVGLAQRYTEKNFIGVDIKGARMWRGAKTSAENNSKNVAFLRTRIELIEKFFGANEISEIWFTFPDPQPQISRENRRLTSPHFLEKYKHMLTSKGLIHLKTDSLRLFDYTIEVLKNQKGKFLFCSHDLYQTEGFNNDLSIQTTYEKIFRKEGKNICYLCFEFTRE
ncbi:MAG: tRNA (guanosine(46)-N7)-methyltransferase TrmB [Bacteroidia bacterium]